MKHVNSKISCMLRITFCLAVSYTSVKPASLPQPGQNLWHMTAQIGTNVDTLVNYVNLISTTTTGTLEIQSSIDACCNFINSSVTTFSTNVAEDFSGTFTVLASITEIATQIVTDFNGTFTAINELGLCAPVPLTSTNVSNGGILLTTTGALYCLSQNLTASLIISASDVTVDLNSFSLLGTIDVVDTATNVIIVNGNVKPLTPISATDAGHAAIVIGGSAYNVFIKNCYIICFDSTATNFIGRDAVNNAGANTTIDSSIIQAGNGGTAQNGGNGIISTSANTKIVDCIIMAGNGVNGGNGVVQQGNNGVMSNLTISGGTGTSTGGSGLTVSSSANENIIQNCQAINGAGNGFTILTNNVVHMLECKASNNVGNGFDLSGSTGQGLIKNCLTLNNTGCGFNDISSSAYQYVGNAAVGNGNTPAHPAGDSNYCISGTPAAFVSPSGPGSAPFYQWTRNADDGTFFSVSNWDNITLN